MTAPDFRALCAELEKACFRLYADMSATQDFNDSYLERMDELRDRARAALAKPQQGASDESWDDMQGELWEKYKTIGYQGDEFMYDSDFGLAMMAVRSHYGAHPAPVPVSERLPDRSHCDGEGRVWWLIQNVNKPIPTWALGAYRINKSEWAQTHWLPHWALPLPEVQS